MEVASLLGFLFWLMHQSQDRKGARPRGAVDYANDSRRGN
jgi:hypothetical protein